MLLESGAHQALARTHGRASTPETRRPQALSSATSTAFYAPWSVSTHSGARRASFLTGPGTRDLRSLCTMAAISMELENIDRTERGRFAAR